jgi:hypothetical protein
MALTTLPCATALACDIRTLLFSYIRYPLRPFGLLKLNRHTFRQATEEQTLQEKTTKH